jgi:protein involved in polysaccharide export with SLBB domain
MTSTNVVRLLGAAWIAALFILTGCTGGAGRGFSILPPQGHKLTESAKAMRDANAPVIDIPRELEKHPLPTYTVEPGDVLLVQPMDLDSSVRLPGDQPILPDGTINLGKYGHLQVMGRTVQEIEEMVRNAVKVTVKDAGYISVRLSARQSKVYYVIGEVNSPGSFQLSGRETVLDALLQAGGLTDQASRDQIILSRPTKPNCPRIVLPVCWKQIVQLGDTATNYQIAPGDRIYVPTRSMLSSIPLLNRHIKTPCGCNAATPFVFPPHQGDNCHVPGNGFRGHSDIFSPVEPVAMPKGQLPPR